MSKHSCQSSDHLTPGTIPESPAYAHSPTMFAAGELAFLRHGNAGQDDAPPRGSPGRKSFFDGFLDARWRAIEVGMRRKKA